MKSHKPDGATYRCAPFTKWAVELDGILVINKESGATNFLKYPQAAIWDLLTREYSYEHIVDMVSAITSLQEDEVNTLIAACLAEWAQTGFLRTAEQ
jgi:hypothetical protein